MSNIADLKQLQEEMGFVETLGSLVQTYEEIYVTRMQKIRKSVVGTRQFTEGLAEIFGELRLHNLRSRLEQQNKGTVKQLEKVVTGERLAVLLTTSQRWSGEINRQVFTEFWQYTKRHPSSAVMIIGKVGKEMYDQLEGKAGYWYFDLAEDANNIEILNQILHRLVEYKEVIVFYGKFISFVHQEKSRIRLTGTEGGSHKGPEGKLKPMRAYLFEPGLKIILDFFESQIVSALFKQSMHESYLAQLGSRVMVLEKAVKQIEDEQQSLAYKHRKLQRGLNYKQQMQAIVGIYYGGSYR